MRINSSCEACLYEKEVSRSMELHPEERRMAFLEEIQSAMKHRNPEICSPEMVSLFTVIRDRYGLNPDSYPKEKYNRMIMELEEKIEERIKTSEDPLETALIYSRVGNYIDFAALDVVSDDQLWKLIEEAGTERIDEQVYLEFKEECCRAGSLMILCDNCGEIVFDKFLVRQLHRSFPDLKVRAMVRGAQVQNDATMEDAIQCGLTEEAEVVTNGTDIAGTVYHRLSSEAKYAFDNSDVIISKGQGNYESLVGNCSKSVYFLFLCKCDLFTKRFRVPRFTGMFIREPGSRI